MKILTKIHSTDEYTSKDIENALVNLTPELVLVIHQRMETFNAVKKIHTELAELHFISSADECGFYPYSGFHRDYDTNEEILDETTEIHLDNHGWVEISDSSGAVPLTSMSNIYMVITCWGVYWETFMDHSPGTWQSELLDKEFIAKLLSSPETQQSSE